MTTSHQIRVLFLATMFASMAVVLAWAGWIGWREWPRWRAVREMRAAVEANEPGRFLDAIERVDSLGVAEAAAEEIAPLGQHPDPRVRMYAVMARTVLGPRGPAEAKELIELFDDPDEDINVRRAAAPCLVLFGEQARAAVGSLNEAIRDPDDPRHHQAHMAYIGLLSAEVSLPAPPYPFSFFGSVPIPPEPDASGHEMAEFLVAEADGEMPRPMSSRLLLRQKKKTGGVARP